MPDSDTPLVSICCITYNHERFIKDCIEGFLKQEVAFPIEIIVHDDASTDRTQELLKELTNGDSRFKLVLRSTNIKSTGVAVFPIVYGMAKGKYIAICEGDDFWVDPLKLQKQVDFLEENEDFALTFHDTSAIDEYGNLVYKSKLNGKGKSLSQVEMVLGSMIPTNTVLFRRALLKKYPKELKVVNGDTFLYAFLGQYGKAHFAENVTPAVYRIHRGGVWSLKSGEEKLRSGLHTYEQLYQVIGKKHKKIVKRVLFSRRVILAKSQSSIWKALAYYIESYKYFYLGRRMIKTWIKVHFALVKQFSKG